MWWYLNPHMTCDTVNIGIFFNTYYLITTRDQVLRAPKCCGKQQTERRHSQIPNTRFPFSFNFCSRFLALLLSPIVNWLGLNVQQLCAANDLCVFAAVCMHTLDCMCVNYARRCKNSLLVRSILLERNDHCTRLQYTILNIRYSTTFGLFAHIALEWRHCI